MKKATAVERAGLTDVLLMGVEMRWISVRPESCHWCGPELTLLR